MESDQPELELETERVCPDFGLPCECNGRYCYWERQAKTQDDADHISWQAWRWWLYQKDTHEWNTK